MRNQLWCKEAGEEDDEDNLFACQGAGEKQQSTVHDMMETTMRPSI